MDSMDFLCINCQELVSQEKVFMHSIICVHPTAVVMKIESEPVMNQLKYKLERLKSALVSHKTMTIPQIDQGLLEFLLEKTQEILNLNMQEPESIEKCSSVAFTLERYAQAHLSPGILLYTERLKMLVIETLKELESNMDSQINKLDLKYREIQQAKINALKDKVSATHNLDEISSQISQIWKDKSSLASLSLFEEEAHEKENDDLDRMIRDGQSEVSKKNDEDLQRYFFSKCLALKLARPARDPAQFIQIPDLYKNVIEQKITVDKWEDFIKIQFDQPEKWTSSLMNK